LLLLAEAPVARKRAVSAARPKAAAKRRVAKPIEDEPQTPNYALRAMDGVEESHDTFALKLNEALDAINAANGIKRPAPVEAEVAAAPGGGLRAWLAALDKLPPIRLPIGPPIPWRLGLPALVALVVVMGVMSRSAGAADSAGVQLPAQQTYPVQQEAPLFAKPQLGADTTSDPSDVSSTAAPAPTASPVTTASTPAAQPIGVSEPAGVGGFDLMDLGIKLVAVLGLAYGSLMLLKKLGYGGAGSAVRATGSSQDVRVVSSIALAPNRSVHVIQVPGGKTLLVGATPTAVNLLAELPTEEQ
jgi:flagellar biogenesis protein FliO